MRDLHVVAVSEDGRHVVLATRRNAASGSFRVAVDDRLAAALRGEAPRPVAAAATPLTPRDIQARLRAGQSVEQIAQSAGVPPERVERYAGPVLAERERVLDGARAAVVQRPRLGPSSVPLAQAVERNLADNTGYQPDSARWSARREESGRWLVELSWSARGRRRTSGWAYDLRTRDLAPLDASSAALGHVAEEDAGALPAARPAQRSSQPTARRTSAPSSRRPASRVARSAVATSAVATSAVATSGAVTAGIAGAGAGSRGSTTAAPSGGRPADARRATGERRPTRPAAAGAAPDPAAAVTTGRQVASRPTRRAASAKPAGGTATTAGTAGAAPRASGAAHGRAPAANADAGERRSAVGAATSVPAPGRSTGKGRPSARSAPAEPAVPVTGTGRRGAGASATQSATAPSPAPSRRRPAPRQAVARASTPPVALGPPAVPSGPPAAPSGPPTLRVVPSAPEVEAKATGSAEGPPGTGPAPARRAVGGREGVPDWADVLFGAAPPAAPRGDRVSE